MSTLRGHDAEFL